MFCSEPNIIIFIKSGQKVRLHTPCMVNAISHDKLSRGASHLDFSIPCFKLVVTHITKIIEVKRNLTQFIGMKFNHNLISIVISSCTSGIKKPFQLTMLNVMGTLSDLFYVSMEIYHGKFTLGNVSHMH